jgi:hypothetical protein
MPRRCQTSTRRNGDECPRSTAKMYERVCCHPVLLPVMRGAVAFAIRSPTAYVFALFRMAEPCLAWKMVDAGFCVHPDYLITWTGACRRRRRVGTKIFTESRTEIGCQNCGAECNR